MKRGLCSDRGERKAHGVAKLGQAKQTGHASRSGGQPLRSATVGLEKHIPVLQGKNLSVDKFYAVGIGE